MGFAIEKDWTTKAGLRAVVVMVDDGSHRCGYIAVPDGHSLHGEEYDAFDVDVHGGVTFSGHGSEGYPASGTDWWFGFDCAHFGDATSYSRRGVFRSLEFVEAECESLASQIIAKYTPEA